MAKVCIIGGGISGLATGEFLSEKDFVVCEKSTSIGGWIQTQQHESGAVLDLAANGWLNNEPAVGELINKLALSAQLVEANNKTNTRWIYHNNALHPAPLSPMALLRTRLLSLRTKLRMLFEPFVSKRTSDSEESLAEFVTRRLGKGTIETLLAPMVAGVFAAHPSEISVKAAFPKLYKMEQEYGSLFQALRQQKAQRPHLQTLKGGAGQLTHTLAQKYHSKVKCNRAVEAIEKNGERWNVFFSDGSITCDAIVFACPAYAQASIIRGVLPEIAHHLDAIPYSSVVVVSGIYPRNMWQREPTGFGALVTPKTESYGALGTLFTSCIFPSHSPDETIVTRTILGGTRYPDAIEWDNQELIAKNRKLHSQLFGPENKQPIDIKVFKHHRAIPRYELGHNHRQLAIQTMQQRTPGIFFVGNHLFGVGVKDCIRNAKNTAQLVDKYLGVQ